MTGTPTPATSPAAAAAHLQQLLAFLGDRPYGASRDAWLTAVQQPLARRQPWGRAQLMRLLRRVMIRASKGDLVTLPPCTRRVTLLHFGPEHAASYNALVEVIRRNLLLADWCDDAHREVRNRVLPPRILSHSARARLLSSPPLLALSPTPPLSHPRAPNLQTYTQHATQRNTTHTQQSLLNTRQSKWAKELLRNVQLSCCVAGVLNLVVKDEDLLETLQLLCGRHDLPRPRGTLPAGAAWPFAPRRRGGGAAAAAAAADGEGSGGEGGSEGGSGGGGGVKEEEMEDGAPRRRSSEEREEEEQQQQQQAEEEDDDEEAAPAKRRRARRAPRGRAVEQQQQQQQQGPGGAAGTSGSAANGVGASDGGAAAADGDGAGDWVDCEVRDGEVYYLPSSHPLAPLEAALRHGGACAACAAPTAMPIATPCAHAVCLDCALRSRRRCPVAGCGAAYRMQAVDDPARRAHNADPKWEVSRAWPARLTALSFPPPLSLSLIYIHIYGTCMYVYICIYMPCCLCGLYVFCMEEHSGWPAQPDQRFNQQQTNTNTHKQRTTPKPITKQVPIELIEWQPVFHQAGATGVSGGEWSANWQVTRSTKVQHLLRRLLDAGAAAPPKAAPAPSAPSAAAQAAAALRSGFGGGGGGGGGGGEGAGGAVAPVRGALKGGGYAPVGAKAIVFSQFWVHLKLIQRELAARRVRGPDRGSTVIPRGKGRRARGSL